jgi:hypothetical protein
MIVIIVDEERRALSAWSKQSEEIWLLDENGTFAEQVPVRKADEQKMEELSGTILDLNYMVH